MAGLPSFGDSFSSAFSSTYGMLKQKQSQEKADERAAAAEARAQEDADYQKAQRDRLDRQREAVNASVFKVKDPVLAPENNANPVRAGIDTAPTITADLPWKTGETVQAAGLPFDPNNPGIKPQLEGATYTPKGLPFRPPEQELLVPKAPAQPPRPVAENVVPTMVDGTIRYMPKDAVEELQGSARTRAMASAMSEFDTAMSVSLNATADAQEDREVVKKSREFGQKVVDAWGIFQTDPVKGLQSLTNTAYKSLPDGQEASFEYDAKTGNAMMTFKARTDKGLITVGEPQTLPATEWFKRGMALADPAAFATYLTQSSEDAFRALTLKYAGNNDARAAAAEARAAALHPAQLRAATAGATAAEQETDINGLKIAGAVAGTARDPAVGSYIAEAATKAIPGLVVTSDFRDEAANKKAGGVSDSYHKYGAARDFRIPQGMTSAQVAAKLKGTFGAGYDVVDEGDHVHVEPSPAWSPKIAGFTGTTPAVDQKTRDRVDTSVNQIVVDAAKRNEDPLPALRIYYKNSSGQARAYLDSQLVRPRPDEGAAASTGSTEEKRPAAGDRRPDPKERVVDGVTVVDTSAGGALSRSLNQAGKGMSQVNAEMQRKPVEQFNALVASGRVTTSDIARVRRYPAGEIFLSPAARKVLGLPAATPVAAPKAQPPVRVGLPDVGKMMRDAGEKAGKAEADKRVREARPQVDALNKAVANGTATREQALDVAQRFSRYPAVKSIVSPAALRYISSVWDKK